MSKKKLTGDELKRFSYLRHIPNYNKTDEEFKEYCQLTKGVGLPKPDRNSKVRPLHEK